MKKRIYRLTFLNDSGERINSVGDGMISKVELDKFLFERRGIPDLGYQIRMEEEDEESLSN
jgi:hypothetical protein